VLQPWYDVDPEGAVPGEGRVADLLGKIDLSGVRRLDDVQLEQP
jgi:2-amino-4-hydroxy-6-hydroxymethyldihydropteridine diphosphokinase